eukprot:CAMPEP_0203859658 /NCGR_PEP_ID=MMETSP0359-20131031/11978_1 /ASSEMBLY_ACC=CAM_ASM_000338 /TAXON_ID=268821 /ORGANISM="Scrippsiella Hangoei, Strain SHTV-5" /LENGTH=35 /DNA_ID= /DNA_START= /DNA_END= /DNA_ORIENTATION=
MLRLGFDLLLGSSERTAPVLPLVAGIEGLLGAPGA